MRALCRLVFTLAATRPLWAASTSPSDPFQAISTHVVREAEEPVCCLVPLDDHPETLEDDVLISFEQWKDRQAASNRSRATMTTTASAAAATAASLDTAAQIIPSDSPQELSPHFQVPLTDRFNYASLDCSARVHLTHRSAKSPASILASKKDRYMLSPCNSKEPQFVVVELCDDIRIDTVQLANFEFFSGVFMDFTVSVAKTYTTLEEGWTVVDTYRGKNVRGVQSFHPPTSLRDFYRYIRIQFHSHYGNEYYCPISLLRVYGLTHLEQWKWDIWESEYRGRLEETVPEELEPTQTAQATIIDTHAPTELPLYGPATYDLTSETASIEGLNTNIYTDVSTTSTTTMITSSTASASDTALKAIATPIVSPPTPPSSGGESIYRTIMNRLTALEGNHTLYVRYVEEQTTTVRELIRRLGEDVGRLEGIGKAQAQTYQRKLLEWEKQRKRIELEYRLLSSKVEVLSDEIVLEKRLGIAQLCLLLAVLVFMGLTRGQHGPPMFNTSKRGMMREWSRRHLSLNLGGDWFAKESKFSPPGAVVFPTKTEESKPVLYPITTSRPRKLSAETRSRSHTPNALRTPIRATPATLNSSVRSNSGLAGHRSARRWARTAHLHHVNVRRDDDYDEVFSGRKNDDGGEWMDTDASEVDADES